MAELTLSHVGKVYSDGTRAVTDLSIDISDGELMVFVGPSGCGKTTALRMVAGLESITEGEVCIGDRVVNNLPPRDREAKRTKISRACRLRRCSLSTTSS